MRGHFVAGLLEGDGFDSCVADERVFSDLTVLKVAQENFVEFLYNLVPCVVSRASCGLLNERTGVLRPLQNLEARGGVQKQRKGAS